MKAFPSSQKHSRRQICFESIRRHSRHYDDQVMPLYIFWRSSARSLQAFAHDHELLLRASFTTFFCISYEASVFRICSHNFVLLASSLWLVALTFRRFLQRWNVKSRPPNVLLFLFTTFVEYISWYLLARHSSASHSFCDMYDTRVLSHRITHQFHLRPLYKHI